MLHWCKTDQRLNPPGADIAELTFYCALGELVLLVYVVAFNERLFLIKFLFFKLL